MLKAFICLLKCFITSFICLSEIILKHSHFCENSSYGDSITRVLSLVVIIMTREVIPSASAFIIIYYFLSKYNISDAIENAYLIVLNHFKQKKEKAVSMRLKKNFFINYKGTQLLRRVPTKSLANRQV